MDPRSSHIVPIHALALTLLTLSLGACGDKNNAAAKGDGRTNTAGAAVTRGSGTGATRSGIKATPATGEPLGEAAANLQDLYKTLGQQQAAVDDPSVTVSGEPAAAGDTEGSAGGRASKPSVAPKRITGRQVQGPADGSVAVDSSAFQAPPPKPPQRQVETVLVDRPMNRAELAFRLADRVRVEPGWSPLRQSLAMLGLELVEPGVGGPQVEDLARRLNSDQARATAQLRKVLGEIAASESLAGDPNSLASVLASAAREIAPPPPPASLDLGTVALCTRVDSFGRFTPLATNRIIAGRATRVIVYSEVQNFSQSAGAHTPTPTNFSVGAEASDAASGAAQNWTVQLGQELALFLDSDGTRQWHQPEQSVKDSSRSKRNDYYLVQLIDLPPNLSVGRYNLKVTVRDKANGAEVERAISLEVIADPRLIAP